LGVIYREGNIVKKDNIKALAWFTQAGSLGFPLSMYNAAMMFLEGSEQIK
jgi:TPR repeat protein